MTHPLNPDALEAADECRKAFENHRRTHIPGHDTDAWIVWQAAWSARQAEETAKLPDAGEGGALYWLDRALNHWKNEERGINVEYCIKAAIAAMRTAPRGDGDASKIIANAIKPLPSWAKEGMVYCPFCGADTKIGHFAGCPAIPALRSKGDGGGE